ncbi:energy-coupling factor ABC transporter ATP-binding protein [Furfurilactobacillus siliginis]|uniref:Energy-coupling factor transporter ATP-binding protein EcfA2 n=1 Tax=Furfurilactobacillus siliginis TaxID=348151 RepID=A0A0R2L1U2_9LACO|nr:energy-coupling factor ABC transporter ATP-binding protein [Furfurilactobacillus siliginis]KRN95683.1 ABC transporter family protein [Furfurilactobacillus siliginis]GEK28055.1 energy-coupling factor transporter ATP-binding protein EcfA2 [Furfurilactobacillus siliginis]
MAITFDHVNFTYQPNSPFAATGLKDVNLTLPDGSFTAIIGHTGSGKSTLVQHLNGLLKPTSGQVQVDDFTLTSTTSNRHLKDLHQHVGMVFQFPENQLFDQTVVKDIAFGPLNFGFDENTAHDMAVQAAKTVGLPDNVLERSPFELSGGQMRRVAIAGVLASQPRVLVLDEPTAGLDPLGREHMMQMFEQLHEEQQLTVVLVTHQMDDVADYADQAVVMGHGEVLKAGAPQTIFNDPQWVYDQQLDFPTATKFAFQLQQKGFSFNQLPLTEQQLADQLADQLPAMDGKGR